MNLRRGRDGGNPLFILPDVFLFFVFFGDVKEWEASQVETVRKMAGSSRE